MKIINVKIKDIRLSEYNPRKLSPESKKQLKKSIETFGLVDPIILNENINRKNVLIGGHQRLKIWKELKYKDIPCIYVNLPIDQEKELNIRLNKNQGEFDFKLLEKNFKHDNLVNWGFSPFQFEEVHFVDDPDAIIENNTDYSNAIKTEEAVMLEIPMSPFHKKEIMLSINKYKQNKNISNGESIYEMLCLNNFTNGL